MRVFLPAILPAILCLTAQAQVPGPTPPPLPRINLRELGAPPPMMPHKMRAITGEPYSLLERTVSTRKLPDGTSTTTTHEQRKIRDSAGRERTEFISKNNVPSIVNINDPVTQTIIMLLPWDKTARVTHVPLPAPATPEEEAKATVLRAKQAQYRSEHPAPFDREHPLPPETIAGVHAEGKYTANELHVTMSDGSPVRVIEQAWTAPDLKVRLKLISDDPRGEKITITVSDLTRSEPNPTLFQIPPGYKVIDRSN